MVLDDIAEKSFFFEKVAARPDADVFCDGDLDVVDVAVVPERLEDGVGKAEDEEVLDRFFPEVVVDSVDLGFVEVFGDIFLECFRRSAVSPERFFDDDAGPFVRGFMDIVNQAGLVEFFDDERKKFGLNGEIEDAVPPCPVPAVEGI